MKVKPYLLFDGAMGTYFEMKSGTGFKCELANMKSPRTIKSIHEEYIESGAMAIKTNTFSANTASLKSGFDVVGDVITKGWEIAVSAAKRVCFGFWVFGPLPDDTESFDEYKKISDRFHRLRSQKLFTRDIQHV